MGHPIIVMAAYHKVQEMCRRQGVWWGSDVLVPTGWELAWWR